MSIHTYLVNINTLSYSNYEEYYDGDICEYLEETDIKFTS